MTSYWAGGFMKGDKKHSNPLKEMQLSGKVVLKKIAKGSKSERVAVVLQCGEKEYLLRKWGGNPFRDTSLEMLAEKHITASGLLDRNLFLVKTIKEDL